MKRPKSLINRPRVLTVSEVSEHLRVNRATIYRLLRSKQIPGFLVGSEWRFDPDTIERWSRGEATGQ